MKKKYDEVAEECDFMLGQKVLVLLPVPGNTLHSRCFGPYVCEEVTRSKLHNSHSR